MSSMTTVTVQSQQRLASAPCESSELTKVLRVLLSSMLLLEAAAPFHNPIDTRGPLSACCSPERD